MLHETYTEEEFINELTKRFMEYYSDQDYGTLTFYGCVNGVGFTCDLNECSYLDDEDYDTPDCHYFISVNAYATFEDFDKGNEIGNGQGGAIDLFSEEDIEEYIKDGSFEQTYRSQAEFALSMIFP